MLESITTFAVAQWDKVLKIVLLILPKQKPNFVVLPHQLYENWYNVGTQNEKRSMQISSHWYATNQCNVPIEILGVYLTTETFFLKKSAKGLVLTKNLKGVSSIDEDAIPPQQKRELSVDFYGVEPPFWILSGSSFVATIVFVDQYNKKFKVKANFNPHQNENHKKTHTKKTKKS